MGHNTQGVCRQAFPPRTADLHQRAETARRCISRQLRSDRPNIFGKMVVNGNNRMITMRIDSMAPCAPMVRCPVPSTQYPVPSTQYRVLGMRRSRPEPASNFPTEKKNEKIRCNSWRRWPHLWQGSAKAHPRFPRDFTLITTQRTPYVLCPF
jgi:hypothetical protein